jgi:hypothetical protein
VLTGNISITSVTRYATFARWVIANTGTKNAWIGGTAGIWQLRGTGIFNDVPQTVEARSTQPYGERVLELDLPYQSDQHVALGIATLIRDQRQDETKFFKSVEFYPSNSATLAAFAMLVEPSLIVTASNTMTGLSAATAEVRRVEYEVLPGGIVLVRLNVVPTSTLTVPPSAPTGLAVSVASDTELGLTWTNTDVTSETAIYANGVLLTYAAPGGDVDDHRRADAGDELHDHAEACSLRPDLLEQRPPASWDGRPSSPVAAP